MNNKFKRLSMLLLMFVLIVLPATSPDLILAAAGDQTLTGMVAKSGRGSIILGTSGGKEERLNLGRETAYEPADYRPMDGDKVKVTYYDKDHRGKMIKAVTMVELIKANPDFKEPPNPATGTIKEAGRRAFNVYIPELKKGWTFEIARGWKSIPKGWKPAADDKVKVTWERVASRFGSGYVYTIKTLEKIE